jgi:hypothetical protein
MEIETVGMMVGFMESGHGKASDRDEGTHELEPIGEVAVELGVGQEKKHIEIVSRGIRCR